MSRLTKSGYDLTQLEINRINKSNQIVKKLLTHQVEINPIRDIILEIPSNYRMYISSSEHVEGGIVPINCNRLRLDPTRDKLHK